MKFVDKTCFLILALCLNFHILNAQVQPTDTVADADSVGMNLRITLITCDPGPDAYQMFGHTAIRVKDVNNPIYDIVYNYGVFDSRRDNFIYYFVKGETDYVLSVDPANRFMGRYSDYFGIGMYEQELNLSVNQKESLARLLEVNARPENRTYRYNFLYDNCTTRAINIIEKAIENSGDKLNYRKCDVAYEQTTFRDEIHRFTAVAPWLEFGIDFVLGSEVDKPRKQREQMFIPSVYEMELDSATVVATDGTTRNFVDTKTIIKPTVGMEETGNFPLSPLATFGILLLLTFILCVFDMKRGKLSLWADVAGLFLRSLAGFLVAFLFFFSEHPAVGSNWLVLAFNPLYFIMIPNVFFTVSQKKYMAKTTIKGIKYDIFELANLTVLVFTLLLFVLPLQSLNIAMLPLVLTLLIRSMTRILILNKKVNAVKLINRKK